MEEPEGNSTSLRFPSIPDVPLENSPLSEVICQVKFPPILKIAEQRPSEFQDRIRHRFPGFAQEHGLVLRMEQGSGRPSVGAEMMSRTYRFHSSDDSSLVHLSVDFYALTTRRYTIWEDFAADLALVHESAVDTLTPAYATRVGLRYVNVITTENTGRRTIEEVAGLLRSDLTCQLRTDAWDSPSEMSSAIVVPDGDAKMVLKTALLPPGEKPGLVLDLDYFEEGQITLQDLVERCRRYHDVIYKAFRWCVTDDAIAAFVPK